MRIVRRVVTLVVVETPNRLRMSCAWLLTWSWQPLAPAMALPVALLPRGRCTCEK